MKRNKDISKILLFCVVAVAVVIVLVLISVSNNREKAFSCNYYSIILPPGWVAESEGNAVYLKVSDNTVATITAEEDWMFGQDADRIVANWIGMRASVISQTPIVVDTNENVFEKTVIVWEQSAAEEIGGVEQEPNETHYFYVSENDLFIDIALRDEKYTEDIEQIIKNIYFK